MLKKTFVFAPLTAAIALGAAPLSTTSAIHTQPVDSSPTVSFSGAGTSPTPAASASAPAGWMAVDLGGTHEGYVQNKDLLKSLDVAPGASIYLGPKISSGVLATAQAGDKTTITGLQGKWTQISLEKKLIGYIHVSGEVATTLHPTGATTLSAPVANSAAHASTPAAPSRPAPLAAAPINAVATGVAEAGHAAPIVSLADGGVSLPRQFQGIFVSTRSLLKPRRPFDWALNDDAGKRFAYLDITKLLQIEQIDKYAGHYVVVYGPVRPLGNGQDFVVTVESLQLR